MAAPVYILLGPPGAGKGTQARILASNLNAQALSSGEIIRNSNDEVVKSYIARGMLAKTEDFQRLIENSIRSVPADKIILLDSVARKKGEPEWLLEVLAQLGRMVKQVIFINVPREEAVSRNLKRGRDDDSIEAQQVRWQQYMAETQPVLDFYRGKGLLAEVNGVGSVEEVAKRIESILDEA